MEPSYPVLLVLALLRVAVVAVLSFVVLTRFALPSAPRRSGWEGRSWGDAVLGVSVTVVAATLLGLLGLFDTASLAGLLGLSLAGGAVLRYRRIWRRTLLRRYASVLEWIERVSPPDPVVAGLDDGPRLAPLDLRTEAVRWLRARWRSLTEMSPRTGWWVGIGIVAVVAVGVRIVPALAEAAPFTLRYYASLETVKGLVEGRPVGSPEGWGLHALVMALAEMARVDAGLVMRGVGAVAAGAIAYGVYQTARFYWSGRLGAFAGALFVAAGGPLLPLPLDRQAGAEPLMLAAALALPVFPHLAGYLGDGSRRGITVGVMGLLAAGLVSPPVGILLLVVVSVYVASILLQIRARRGRVDRASTTRYVNRGLRRRTAVMIGAGVATLASWWLYTTVLGGVSSQASIFFFEAAEAPRWLTPATALALALGALTVAAPFVPGRAPFEPTLPRRGALLRTGGQTLVMLAIWVGTGARFDGLSGAALVLLMTAIGVNVALLANEAVVRLAPRRANAGEERPGLAAAWAPAASALAVGVVVIATGWAVPVPGPGVEPGGFVRAYHAIDRAYQPYTWTAISHLGTGVLTRHRGRFMDYEFFLQNYDASAYDHRGRGAIPTPDVFVFVEREDGPQTVQQELMPSGEDATPAIEDWLAAYAARTDQAPNVSVFYRDEQIEVVRISRPASTLLELFPEDEALTLDTSGDPPASSPR
ncbi:MAG: hypothetical protein AAF845_12670 [Bacteroidota bacterium]